MHRFNYDRSLVLGSVETLADGSLKIKTMFNGSITLPRSSVRLTTIKRLADSSLQVVDFGKGKRWLRRRGRWQPTSAIIAAGDKSRLPQLRPA